MSFDLSVPNAKPGPCAKCKGTGRYTWGGTVNGKSRFSGSCHACAGTGKQTAADIRRNKTYNRFKIRSISL